MINPLEIEKPDNYSSYCTTGGVNTDNSTQCAANLLTGFDNVIFETYLIDSEENCPNERETHNRCVFRCDTGFHLTGDLLGDGKTMCYKDCVLPWDTSVKKKHNEMITGYNVNEVSCSNHDYKFPRSLPRTFSTEDGWTKELRVSG
ncbi:hypothetical protein J6T66_00980 [bacterium]|nr:hypothetical protein [bacterium]